MARPSPAIQAVTDGRLTFKDDQHGFLGKPGRVRFTFGRGECCLIHSPRRHARIEAYINRVLADGIPDVVGAQLETRFLQYEECQVDEQCRVRVPALYLMRIGLTSKTDKVVLICQPRSGWIELWSVPGFFDSLKADEQYMAGALAQLAQASLREESESISEGE